MIKNDEREMYVEPGKGRTVRFPAGHARQGDRIPPANETPGKRGTKVPRSSYYVRAINVGDLRVVAKVAKAKGPVASPTPGYTEPTGPTWPESFSGMKKDELVALAEEFGLDVSGMKKDEVLDALEAAKADDAEAATEEG